MTILTKNGKKTTLDNIFENFGDSFELLERLFDDDFKMRFEKLHDNIFPPMNVFKKPVEDGVKYKIILKVGKIDKDGLKVTIFDDTLRVTYNRTVTGPVEKLVKDIIDEEWKPEFVEFDMSKKKYESRWDRKMIIPSIDTESVTVIYKDNEYLIVELVSTKRKKLKEIRL